MRYLTLNNVHIQYSIISIRAGFSLVDAHGQHIGGRPSGPLLSLRGSEPPTRGPLGRDAVTGDSGVHHFTNMLPEAAQHQRIDVSLIHYGLTFIGVVNFFIFFFLGGGRP